MFIPDLTTQGIEPNPGPGRRKGRRSRKNTTKNATVSKDYHAVFGSNTANGVNLLNIARPITLTMPLQAHKVFADKFITNCLYSEAIDFGGGQATNYYQFRLGSIFDPDITSTGHQPYGHDQLASIYVNYRVVKITYELTFTASSSDVPVQVVSCPSAENGVYSTGAQIALLSETQNAMSDLVSYRTNTVTHAASFTPWAILGITRNQYMDDPETASGFGNNPVKSPTLNIGLRVSDSTTVGRMICYVRLNYRVEAFGLQGLGSS